MKLKWFIVGALIAAVLQTGALGKIIYDRAELIRNGTEVVLQSGMVDPRDLFRGHYVVLNLTIGRLASTDVKVDGEFEFKEPVYVSLKKGENEFWEADTLYAEYPSDISAPVIRGEYNSRNVLVGSNQNHQIRFPIDRFFAEKSHAKDLEKVRRDRNLGVVIALDEKGNAAIKGISVEGELIYNEPVW